MGCIFLRIHISESFMDAFESLFERFGLFPHSALSSWVRWSVFLAAEREPSSLALSKGLLPSHTCAAVSIGIQDERIAYP